jgi:hypothetical protein
MMGYFPLLLSAGDWEALGRRFGPNPARSRVVFVNESSALACAWARLLSALDTFDRLELRPARDGLEPRTMVVVEDPNTKQTLSGSRAIADCLAALPLGLPFAWLLRRSPIAGVADFVGRIVAAHAEPVAGALRARPFASAGRIASPRSAEPPPSSGVLRRRRFATVARELGAAVLLVTLASQLLVENRAIPQRLKVAQPSWMTQLVVYPRLMQGWQMFAADVPTGERMLYVEAVTVGGRHVDPYNEAASRVARLPIDTIPPHLEQDEFWCDYTNRIPDNEAYWRAFKEWIFAYHHRTGRPEDRVVSFEARLIEVDEPAPGEVGQKNVRTKVMLSARE